MIDVDTTSTPSASPDPVTTEPVTAARLNLVNAALLACRCGRSVRHKIWRRARARAAAGGTAKRCLFQYQPIWW